MTDASGQDEVRPADICLVSGSGYGKDKKLKGAKADLTLRAYSPLAAGVGQSSGMDITASEASADDDDPSDDDSKLTDATKHGVSVSDEADWGKVVGAEKADVEAGALSQRFYTNMDWWDVAEQPSSFDSLPPEFLEAKSLWSKSKKGSQDRIIELLSPFVGALIIPSNISGWEELFVENSNEAGWFEIEAAQIKVVGIDFSKGPIPKCKAEAFLEVEVVPTFPDIDLEEWQENNDRFWVAVSFYWNIPRNDETEDLDFSYGDNQGVECLPMDSA